MDLDTGAGLSIDASRVPTELHHLIPLVQRWGFKLQEDQDEFVTRMRAFPDEIEEFNRQVDASTERIVAWGRTLTEFDQHISKIDAAGWAHPYWDFLATLKVRELTEPESSGMNQRMYDEVRLFQFRQCAENASNLFRAKDYSGFVELLEPYEDLLDKSQTAKLEFARKRIE